MAARAVGVSRPDSISAVHPAMAKSATLLPHRFTSSALGVAASAIVAGRTAGMRHRIRRADLTNFEIQGIFISHITGVDRESATDEMMIGITQAKWSA